MHGQKDVARGSRQTVTQSNEAEKRANVTMVDCNIYLYASGRVWTAEGEREPLFIEYP